MDKLRLRLTKTGRAVYISHLDLMRTMQRAFLRGEIPLKYSEGFNPHAQIAFALPLSVGTSSICELMDFSLREYMAPETVLYRLNRSLPEGIEVTRVYESPRKFRELKWLDIDGRFEYDGGNAADRLGALTDFFSRDEIIIEKKTKRGTGPADIAPAIRSICFDAGEHGVDVKAILSAQEPSLNPEHLVTALRQLAPDLTPDFAFFRRVEVYDSNMVKFE